MSGNQVVVLGAGRVGRAIAFDLARSGLFTVKAVDCCSQHFSWLQAQGVATEEADLTEGGSLEQVVAKARWVVNAVPGFLGFRLLQALVDLGKEVVDVTFMPEDPRSLQEVVEAKDLRVAVDCGVAPGLSHLLLGFWYKKAHALELFTCYVGGLPKQRLLPWEYKAPFSPVDVLEEYTRPARLRRQGQLVVLPAMSEPELRRVPPLGTLEAFLTDGLRTALESLPVPFMEEKTLRYPGHREKVLLLQASGLLSPEPVDVDGVRVSPLQVTAKALQEAWRLEEGEEDVTIMELVAVGSFADGQKQRRLYLFDAYDPASRLSSMARTTGFTAAAVLTALAKGLGPRRGLLLPEILGQDLSLTGFVLDYLKQRGIHLEGDLQ
jgi:saccharopine dehydrogenase-like NADP-dependent oxidoreductase